MFFKRIYSRSIEDFGNIINYALPAYALGMVIYEKDYKTLGQYSLSFVSAQLSTEILKRVVKEKRPNGTSDKSFPSGHAASVFSAATFIHKRYGINQAILPYILATFTAYSRVQAKKHYVHDVLAGAAISTLFTWIFVDTKNDKYNLMVDFDRNGFNFNFTVKL